MIKRKLFSALVIFMILKGFSGFAQTAKGPCMPGEVDLQFICCIFETSSTDFTAKPYYWGFSFVSKDKAKLDELAKSVNAERKEVMPLKDGDGFIFCIETQEAYTPQTLWTKISEWNRLAKINGIEEMVSFGLTEKNL